jgi:hypothetical protein
VVVNQWSLSLRPPPLKLLVFWWQQWLPRLKRALLWWTSSKYIAARICWHLCTCVKCSWKLVNCNAVHWSIVSSWKRFLAEKLTVYYVTNSAYKLHLTWTNTNNCNFIYMSLLVYIFMYNTVKLLWYFFQYKHTSTQNDDYWTRLVACEQPTSFSHTTPHHVLPPDSTLGTKVWMNRRSPRRVAWSKVKPAHTKECILGLSNTPHAT